MSCTRRQFLTLVPATIGMGVLCAALPGCSTGGVSGTVTVTDGIAALTFVEFPQLMQAGGGVIVDTSEGGTIAVIRTAANAATALDAICTHAGCTVGYNAGAQDLECGCHGSAFSLSGAVTHGPAARPLASYPAAIGVDSINVTLG